MKAAALHGGFANDVGRASDFHITRYFDKYGNVQLMDEEQVIRALAALAHPVRLKVFRALVVAGPAGMTPGVMQEGLGVPGTTLSFHLKELATAGLATIERASRNLVYRAAYDQMNDVLAYLTANCCAGAKCAVGSNTAACGC